MAPRRGPVFAAVVPAYNVGPHIAGVIAGVPAWVEHLFVVDDASTDDTLAIARAAVRPGLVVIHRGENGGVGAAMKSGYLAALEAGADVVVKIDGDGQMDPAQLPALVKPLVLGLADYTKGNRFRMRSALRSMPAVRRLGNLGLSFLTKLASGYWNVFDPTNGYTAIRREVLAEIPMERVADRYFFEISMLVWLNVVGAAVRDVTMPARYGDERSNLRVSSVLASFPLRLLRAMLARIWEKYFVYDFTAVSLFIVSGLPLMTAGAILGARWWTHSILTGKATTAGQVMLSTFPLIVGFQLLLQAFVTDIAQVPQTSTHGPLGAPGEEALDPRPLAG